MKIQELAIIFIIIILPISLLLSEYTKFQIQTITLQTEYDAKLTTATYDAIKAFQLNSADSTTSDLANSKIRDIEASVATFRNSIMSAFELRGYSEDEINNYIPALVYTLYDGFYIYSPYENTNYRYKDQESDEIITKINANESDIVADDNGEDLYGLKPYISYSCRYIKGNIDVVITYALDNYITVQGMIGSEYVNKGGYLIDNIKEINGNIFYNGVEIKTEQLSENILGRTFKYAKKNGIKYYLDEENEQILSILNGILQVQCSKGDEAYEEWANLIKNNVSARQYYRDAKDFTDWLDSIGLKELRYCDAYDEVIDTEGLTSIVQVWGDDTTKIFDDINRNIENELSNFNQHRLAVIRHKIETNLAIAISNYNSYSGAATSNVFQMPELKEDEWDNITHNISMISFLQGLSIGGKIYNGYSLVTNSESKEVVLEENIYILGTDGNYHKIGDNDFEVDYGGTYGNEISAGRLNLDFKRAQIVNNNKLYYYYPLEAYNASYNSVIMQNNVTTYDDIYEYVNNCGDNELKQAFYTALGRERAGRYNSVNIVGAGTIFDNALLSIGPVSYTVRYVAPDATNVPEGMTLEHGQNFIIDSLVPEMEGHQFLGWRDNLLVWDEGNLYHGGDEYQVKSDATSIVLYATWKKDTYTVTYDANGGIGAPSGQTKYYGEPLILASDIPTREGYDFEGWHTLSTASTPEYLAGAQYTENRDITLFAVWKRKIYTVTYNSNGGNHYGTTNTIINQLYQNGDTVQIARDVDEPSRSGYTFEGWSENSSATTATYKNTDTFTCTKNTTLYAIWKIKTYTVTYNANGGSGEPGAQTKTHGVNLQLSTTEPTRTGYTFEGWATSADQTTKTYSAGDFYNINADVTLYAVWKIKTYTVTYNANGGTGEPSSQTKTYGLELELSTTKPTRDGYNFLGWARTSSATSAQYQAGGKYTTNANATLYAVWEIKTYTVTYDANGGTGAPEAQTKTHGVNLTLSSTKPTRSGYTFLGWNTDKSALLGTYSAGGTYATDADVTLYAIWKNTNTSYKITINANGGSFEGTSNTSISLTKNYGATVYFDDFADAPYRSGYTFLGWSTDKSATTAQYQHSDSFTCTGTVTYYAIWKKN